MQHPPAHYNLADVLPYVDVFTPNDQEGQALTGELEPHRQASRFLAAGCGTAVITRGGRGALLMNGDETLEAPIAPVEVIDSSGAGDAFAAGFIVGLLEGWPVRETLAFASVIGASACTKLGTHAGVFTRPEAEAYLAAHRLEARRVALLPRSPGDTSRC